MLAPNCNKLSSEGHRVRRRGERRVLTLRVSGDGRHKDMPSAPITPINSRDDQKYCNQALPPVPRNEKRGPKTANKGSGLSARDGGVARPRFHKESET